MALHDARSKSLDEDVCPVRRELTDFASLRLAEVELDRVSPAIDDGIRPSVAPGALDAHNPGPQIGEQHRAVGAWANTTELQNPQPRQGAMTGLIGRWSLVPVGHLYRPAEPKAALGFDIAVPQPEESFAALNA